MIVALPSKRSSARQHAEQLFSATDRARALLREVHDLARERLGPVADRLVVAIAVSLPWSTSASAIVISFWLITVLSTLDVACLRREFMTPAGDLPVLLAVLGWF